MKNRTQFEKILCWIPLVSTPITILLTYYNFAKHKAPIKKWLHFVLIAVLSVFFVFLLNRFVLSGEYPILNFIVSYVILTKANLSFFDLQMKEGDSAENAESNRFVLPRGFNNTSKEMKTTIVVVVVIAIIILFSCTAGFFFWDAWQTA